MCRQFPCFESVRLGHSMCLGGSSESRMPLASPSPSPHCCEHTVRLAMHALKPHRPPSIHDGDTSARFPYVLSLSDACLMRVNPFRPVGAVFTGFRTSPITVTSPEPTTTQLLQSTAQFHRKTFPGTKLHTAKHPQAYEYTSKHFRQSPGNFIRN